MDKMTLIDGEIGYDEFVQWFKKPQRAAKEDPDAKLKRLFLSFDNDESGTIGPQEFVELCQQQNQCAWATHSTATPVPAKPMPTVSRCRQRLSDLAASTTGRWTRRAA